MRYYYPIVDEKGYTHSIDMVYLEYFSYLNPSKIVELVQGIHEKYPDVRYDEHLGRAPHSKYDYYCDGIAIGGAYVSAGKYTNYDKESKTFDLLPMFELRVNPNKYAHEQWFKDLLSELLKVGSSGRLRKYDYAVDVPKDKKCVEVFETRKERGLFKGTRYFGQEGRHGFAKIYDKQADMKRQNVEIGVLTRIEHTFMANKEPSLEKIYILENEVVNTDYSGLNDTDKAIIDMYLRLKALKVDYELILGRKKMEKLKEYISGKYVLLDYGNILSALLDNIKTMFRVADIVTDEDGFMQVSGDEELPFD